MLGGHLCSKAVRGDYIQYVQSFDGRGYKCDPAVAFFLAEMTRNLRGGGFVGHHTIQPEVFRVRRSVAAGRRQRHRRLRSNILFDGTFKESAEGASLGMIVVNP